MKLCSQTNNVYFLKFGLSAHNINILFKISIFKRQIIQIIQLSMNSVDAKKKNKKIIGKV